MHAFALDMDLRQSEGVHSVRARPCCLATPNTTGCHAIYAHSQIACLAISFAFVSDLYNCMYAQRWVNRTCFSGPVVNFVSVAVAISTKGQCVWLHNCNSHEQNTSYIALQFESYDHILPCQEQNCLCLPSISLKGTMVLVIPAVCPAIFSHQCLAVGKDSWRL